MLRGLPVQITKFLERHSISALRNVRSCSIEVSKTSHSKNPAKDAALLSEEPEIIIPQRIPRGPTDILKALASTVGKDYTAPHYKYHDDPYLIPASNISKRSYTLSKESGRRAARYFLENYPFCFSHNPADPIIEDFMAPKKYTEKTEVTIDDLHSCIQRIRVKDAITVYENLSNKGVKLDEETKQAFLEFLCFYNCAEPVSEEFIEERWFRVQSLQESRKTWNDNGLAETLFKSMENKSSQAYCAMIQGMTKYFQTRRAFELFQEMQDKQLPANLKVYNGLLSIVPYVRESSETRWTLVLELLTSMKNEGISPDVRTFNNVLEVLSKTGFWRYRKTYALKVMAEMKHLGIEPSLATYYYLLVIFCREKNVVSPILYEIMDHIENKTFEIQDPKDVFFLVTAMDVCHNHLMDKNLAYRVHDFLQKNYNLIGDSYKESIYFQHFFKLLCSTESIDTFIQFYNKYVPNVYTPEPSVMHDIIQTLEINDALHFLPQIWSDIIVFDQANRENIVTEILAIMARSQPSQELQEKFVTIAWDILERVEEQQQQERLRNKIQWTGSMLADIMTVCLNAKDIDKAWLIMYKIKTEQDSILGVPGDECLKNFCKASLEAEHPDRAIFCLQYALEVGSNDAALYLKDTIENYQPMSEELRLKLKEVLGGVASLREDTNNDDNGGSK